MVSSRSYIPRMPSTPIIYAAAARLQAFYHAGAHLIALSACRGPFGGRDEGRGDRFAFRA
jgi:hypothetical protein